jgi:hypothetical protein
MSGYQFNYTPRQASMSLASLAPLAFDGGIRFSPNYSFSIVKSNPEVVTEGFIKGRNEMVGSITEGALSALGSVTGAYTAARDEKKALEAEERKFGREKELATLKLGDVSEKQKEQDLENKVKELQIKEIENRLKTTVPENAPRVRERGFFKEQQAIDFQTPLPEATPRPDQTSVDEDTIDIPEPMAGPQGISQAQPQAGYFEMDIPEAMAKPLAELNALPTVQTPQVLAMQGTTLPLAPISGAEKQPPITMQTSPTSVRPQVVTTPPPLAATEPIQAPPAQQAPQVNPAEYLDYLTSMPYESPADAYEAQQRLASLFPEDKFNLAEIETQKDPATGQRIHYVNPPVKKVPPVEGMVLTDVKETDGKVTKSYKPAVPIEKQITQVEAPLKGMQAVLDAIQDIKGIYGGWSPGVGGASSVLKYVPSSDAWNVSELLKPIYANNAFQTLMEMKAASPTGGALGAVSETELQLLINSVAALGQNLDAEYFGENLLKLEKGIEQTKAAIENRVTELKGGGKSKIIEGQKAKGPNGEMIIYKGGKWVQMQ